VAELAAVLLLGARPWRGWPPSCCSARGRGGAGSRPAARREAMAGLAAVLLLVEARWWMCSSARQCLSARLMAAVGEKERRRWLFQAHGREGAATSSVTGLPEHAGAWWRPKEARDADGEGERKVCGGERGASGGRMRVGAVTPTVSVPGAGHGGNFWGESGQAQLRSSI
jgi:hypothetical protein